MMRNVVSGLVLLAASLVFVGRADESPTFQDAHRKYERGDYAAAMSDFRWLAEMGDGRAQLLLALSLYEGLHVPQDLAQAYAWLEIASSSTISDTALAKDAAATQRILALSISGKDLLKAERQVQLYWTARKESLEQSSRAARLLIYPDGKTPATYSAPGCASDPQLRGCSASRDPGTISDGCGTDFTVPDRYPSIFGASSARSPFGETGAVPRLNKDAIVRVAAHVAASGLVCRAAILKESGHYQADKLALLMVRTWRFQPATLAGAPVPSPFVVVIHFRAAG